jgi:flagellar basal-body rod modification protein FlgD
MDTSAIQSSTGGLSGALTGNAAASGMGKEDFLKLLVAQLAHQDPLAPMENTEFVAQLAQFSSLEQLMGVNSNLGLLQVAQTAMTNSQVAGLIGREIEARGDTLNHTSGPEAINFDLSSSAKEVTVKVRDAKGNLIRTIDAGSRIGGVNSVTWDGKDSMGNTMPAGTYSVEVTAKDASGNPVGVSSRFKGVVTGINFRNGIPQLEVGSTIVQVGDVLAVRQIETQATNGS